MDPTLGGAPPTTVIQLDRSAPTDAHALHRAVYTAAHPTHGRVLWALPEPGLLVVRSPRPPAWEEIPGALAASTTTTPIPGVGVRVGWALVANPCKATGPRDQDGRPLARSRRQPLPESEWDAWVRRKLDGALAVDQVGYELLPARTARPRDGRPPIVHTRVAYAGTATVVGPDALARLLACGIGPGKAFGCGLLALGEAR